MEFYAQPYEPGGKGFYFSDFEEFEKKEKASRHEEFEIQFIDGTGLESLMFNAIEPDQVEIERFIEFAEGKTAAEVAAIRFLTDSGCAIDEVKEKLEDVSVYPGDAEEYAYDFISDCYDLENMMGNLSHYFDYEKFTRDLQLNGDISEEEVDGETFTITNANCI